MDVASSVLLKKIARKPPPATDQTFLAALAGALETSASSAFSNVTGLPATALTETCGPVETGQAAMRLEATVLAALIRDPDGDLCGYLALDSGLVTALTDILTCGDVSEAPGGHQATGTGLEADLCRSATDALGHALSTGLFATDTNRPQPVWTPLIAVTGLTVPPDALSGCVCAELSVEIGTNGRQGRLVFCVAAPVPDRDDGRSAASGTQRAHWAGAVARMTGDLPVALSCVAGRTELPISRISAFRAGDSFDLPVADLNSVSIEAAGGLVLARGMLGSLKGNKAFRFPPGQISQGSGDSGTGDDQGDFAPGLE